MIRQIISGFLQSRTFYERARVHLEAIKDPLLLNVVAAIDAYYTADTFASKCDATLIAERVCLSIPNEKKHADIVELVDGLANEYAVSLPNLEEFVIRVRENAIRLKLRDECASLSPNKDAINGAIGDWLALNDHKMDAVDVSIGDPSALFNAIHQGGILIGPEQMRRALGHGLLRSHHTLIVGQSNIGKTTAAISFSCDMLRQGLRGLWIENEEDTAPTKGRFFCNLCNVGEDDIYKCDITELDDEARRNGKDNMVFVDMAPGTLSEISAAVRRFKPDFLVVNQIRNLSVRADNRTNQLEAAANGVRAIGKQHDLYTFSVTQAGASADGKQFLEASDIDHSKTGIIAAVDLAIGIGADSNDIVNEIRGVSMFKNKPGRRATVFACKFYPEVSRLGEIV